MILLFSTCIAAYRTELQSFRVLFSARQQNWSNLVRKVFYLSLNILMRDKYLTFRSYCKWWGLKPWGKLWCRSFWMREPFKFPLTSRQSLNVGQVPCLLFCVMCHPYPSLQRKLEKGLWDITSDSGIPSFIKRSMISMSAVDFGKEWDKKGDVSLKSAKLTAWGKHSWSAESHCLGISQLHFLFGQ